jgi:hypothetical protein
MAQVLRDLKDLAVLLRGDDLAPDDPIALDPIDPVTDLPDLAELISQLEAARSLLVGAVRRDEERREAALRALAAVPALRDDAEVRWREQPRYPAATAVRQRHGPAPTAVGAKPPEPAAPTPSAAQAQAAPPTGQLPLFG